MDAILAGLNPAQLQAVQHSPDVPLQILAGPGSGKTKVLTSRIAYLILHHSLPPSSICAVTFTNKAANEMRDRLIKIIGDKRTDEVRMGTFHALCALFLRRHGHMIGLGRNFTICDAEESKKIISNLLRVHKDYLIEKNISLKDATVLSLISKAKAKGQTAEEMMTELRAKSKKPKDSRHEKAGIDGSEPPDNIAMLVAQIYHGYERSLKKNNCLDFDDLLVHGVKLFSQHETTAQWCKHVLVDEFQDTNIMQYKLMRYVAASSRCVTVVGDPDQSIYGWRSAEIANLAKMRKDFSSTQQIFLEQNYRSTYSILSVSMAIVDQDNLRIKKTLHTSHPAGPTPVLRSFPSEQDEASHIAVEIKRLAAHTGGMLRWGDFAILLRFNALSRPLESALQKEGIPSRILGGHKFFERLEVKDLLAYLQLVDNPDFAPAFSRAVNVPTRGIGEKTLTELGMRAQKSDQSMMTVVEKINDAKTPDVKPPVKRKLAEFVKTIRALRKATNEGTSPADLIHNLLELTEYQEHLRRTQQDWESRWENVQELITFAREVDITPRADNPQAEEGEENNNSNVTSDTPLRLFLQASMLSSDGDTDESDKKERVTIATCHAAKGLEWPVVMVPAVEQGIFPFYRSEDLEEERRLLYVACTRAQGLLYLSHTTNRKAAGENQRKELSEFLSAVVKHRKTLLASQVPELSYIDCGVIAGVLNRPLPPKSGVQRTISEFNRTTRHQSQMPASESLSMGQSANPPASYVPSFQTSRSWLLGAPAPPQPTRASSGTGVLTIAKPLSPARTITVNTTIATTQTSRASSSVTGPSLANSVVSTGFCARPGLLSYPSLPQSSSATSRLPRTGPENLGVGNVPTSTGVKRRLGMGRVIMGYANKRFKPPT